MINTMLFHIYLVSQIVITNLPVVEITPSNFPKQAVGNFLSIDVKYPPLDGLWIDWEDARQFAHDLDNERNEWKRLLYRQQRDANLGIMNHQALEDHQETSMPGQFWSKWGFPIGIGVGLVLGAGISVAVIQANKGK